MLEALRLRHRGKAGKKRVDEDRPSGRVDTKIMGIEIAGGVGRLRYEQPVIALRQLARRQRILEPPQLVERRHPHGLAIRPQSHAAAEGAFEHRETIVRLQAYQEQLPRLIGGEGQRQVMLRQPFRELP